MFPGHVQSAVCVSSLLTVFNMFPGRVQSAVYFILHVKFH